MMTCCIPESQSQVIKWNTYTYLPLCLLFLSMPPMARVSFLIHIIGRALDGIFSAHLFLLFFQLKEFRCGWHSAWDVAEWSSGDCTFSVGSQRCRKKKQKQDVQLSPTLVAVHLGAELDAAHSLSPARIFKWIYLYRTILLSVLLRSNIIATEMVSRPFQPWEKWPGNGIIGTVC